MTDFNTAQMSQLLGQPNVTVVYLWATGDYWIRQQEFCDAFRAVPLTQNVVIHVQFEGLSLTHCQLVPTVQQIMQETGRPSESVFIFSPNANTNDSPWINLFWRQYKISDEFVRSQTYQIDADVNLDLDWKSWALFVGRRTTPRLLALYDIWRDPALRAKCLLSKMIEPSPPVLQPFEQVDLYMDQLDEWMPITNPIEKMLTHKNFRGFCQGMPIDSVDGAKITDQYLDVPSGENRNFGLTTNLINLGRKYLFEITFETMTRGLTFTPSEKTIRTMMAQKPMVVYAPRHFLQHLRSLGFRTFGNLWDEGYDECEGLERYQRIMKIVKNVADMPAAQQLELYDNSRQICNHNKQQLIAISKRK